jgi:DtxR family transcriptional regulator, Mn-dependent transcriptional regulator
MDKAITATVEDYLKAIYELTQEHERALTNEIAEQMGVTAASTTGMIQRLASAQPPLVDYQKHRGAALTPEGQQNALEVIRRHRLIEAFLQAKLGYSWDEVHEEADRLEHVISEELEERISQALGDPAYDPHGDPIPTRDFHMPGRSTARMSELKPGDRASVSRINDADPNLLRYLASIGLMPNSQVAILASSPLDGNLQIQIDDRPPPVVLGLPVTRQIFIELAQASAQFP